MFLGVLRSPRSNKFPHRSILCLRLETARASSVFIFVSSTISALIRAARADGPMGFRKAFAMVSSSIGPSAGGVGRVRCFLLSFYAFALPLWRSHEREKWPGKRHSRHGIRRRRFSPRVFARDPPPHYLCLMTRNYVWTCCKSVRWKNETLTGVSEKSRLLRVYRIVKKGVYLICAVCAE